jgi:recombinational DNA repair ATPase RecF
LLNTTLTKSGDIYLNKHALKIKSYVKRKSKENQIKKLLQNAGKAAKEENTRQEKPKNKIKVEKNRTKKKTETFIIVEIIEYVPNSVVISRLFMGKCLLYHPLTIQGKPD